MSERKVLQKYYPPDFDPRELTRRRTGQKTPGPNTGLRFQTVRIMAPFSMKCTTCGEFIYKGRKFNARKETNPSQKYLNIQIFQLHIKCTRCSAEIIFRTDPKNNDYAMVKGAVRNAEPWRNRAAEEESVEERLDRLEREEAEAEAAEGGGAGAEKNAMAELEAKNADARLEMAAGDMLDRIRQRNARIHQSEKEGMDYADCVPRPEEEERGRMEREDEEEARRVFAEARAKARAVEQDVPVGVGAGAGAGAGADESGKDNTVDGKAESRPDEDEAPPLVKTSFKRVVKKKKDHAALLGIKKKPMLV